MTRGQVASVSIGSGFRNAPGMPEPNIFNSVAMLGSASPGKMRRPIVSYRPLESYTAVLQSYTARQFKFTMLLILNAFPEYVLLRSQFTGAPDRSDGECGRFF